MKNLPGFSLLFAFILAMFIYSGCEQTTGPIENTPINTGQSLNKAFQTRPFTGKYVYSLLSQVNDSVSVYLGTGTATHLGYCTIIDTVIHHYTQTGLTVDGSDWITCASGELLHMTWFMDYYDPTTWVWEISYGTGRFEGVTGNGTYTAGFTPSGDLWVIFTGTLTY
jgi:hypothetical protein